MNTHKAFITTSVILISTIGMVVFAQQQLAQRGARGTQSQPLGQQFAQQRGQPSGQSCGQHFAQQGQQQQDGTCPNGIVGTQSQQRLHSHDPSAQAAAHNHTRQQLRDLAQCVLE